VRARRSSVGFDFVHSTVDDHSRLAYGEIHVRGRCCVTGILRRRTQRAPHPMTDCGVYGGRRAA
jgi:hypothetical protein